MTSEGSGEIERLWQYTKRIVGFTEHQSITSSTLVHSEFEESEDNLLTLVLFNPIELGEPENLLAFKLPE